MFNGMDWFARTESEMCEGEGLKGLRTCFQYVLSIGSEKAIEFDRSKVDSVRKFMCKGNLPLIIIGITNQS